MSKTIEKDYSQDMIRDLRAAEVNIAAVLDEQVGDLCSTLQTAAYQVAGVLRWLERSHQGD